MRFLLFTLVASVVALNAQQPAAKPTHYMQIWSNAGAFHAVAKSDAVGPHPPVPIGVLDPSCRVLPFFSSTWYTTGATANGCTQWSTVASSPGTTSYLAQWIFSVKTFGPIGPNDEGTEAGQSVVVTNGFQFATYCSAEYPPTYAYWSSYSTTAVNPSSNKDEPAFVVALTATNDGVITMTGTQVTFWNSNSILDCQPTTCQAPCY